MRGRKDSEQERKSNPYMENRNAEATDDTPLCHPPHIEQPEPFSFPVKDAESPLKNAISSFGLGAILIFLSSKLNLNFRQVDYKIFCSLSQVINSFPDSGASQRQIHLGNRGT